MYRDIEGAVSIYDQGAKAGVDIAGIYLYRKCVFGKGEMLYFQWKFIHIYREGIMQAVVRVVRLMELILGSSLMTYTTTPTELTDGLEKAFHPLTKIHVPVHEIALMMSITLRFIPILIEELDRIIKAQMARGVDFEAGNVFQKLKRTGRILMPLLHLQLDGRAIWHLRWKHVVIRLADRERRCIRFDMYVRMASCMCWQSYIWQG